MVTHSTRLRPNSNDRSYSAREYWRNLEANALDLRDAHEPLAPSSGEFGHTAHRLAIATALWSGVQALNEQARRSYDRAAAVFGTGSTRSLVSTRGGLFSQDLYVKLRMAGWKVSPVLEGTVRIGDNSLRLIGSSL